MNLREVISQSQCMYWDLLGFIGMHILFMFLGFGRLYSVIVFIVYGICYWDSITH